MECIERLVSRFKKFGDGCRKPRRGGGEIDNVIAEQLSQPGSVTMTKVNQGIAVSPMLPQDTPRKALWQVLCFQPASPRTQVWVVSALISFTLSMPRTETVWSNVPITTATSA